MRRIENFDIVRTVYLGIFRYIQIHSAIFSHVKVKAYSGIIEAFSSIFRHIRTLAYLEPEASSKVCQTCKMIRDIQSPGIVRTVYLSIGPRHGHKYTKYKMYLSIMMVTSIKQHLSNI